MKIRYEAANSIDADIVKNVLQQQGIPCHLKGDYLQGGAGSLPAFGLVSLAVDDEYVDLALNVIRQYDNGDFSLTVQAGKQ